MIMRGTALFFVFLSTTQPSGWGGETFTTEARYTADQLARTREGKEAPDWQVSNFEYPESSVGLEPLAGSGQGLRIGNPDEDQNGRYTVSLRYPWSTGQGFRHEVSVRFSADYGLGNTSAASFQVAGPGGSGMINLANGFLLFDQPWGDRLDVPDLTADATKALNGAWKAKNLHTYTLRWEPTGNTGDVMFEVLVDNVFIKRLPGRHRSLDTRPSLWFSFEYGNGWGLIESVQWKSSPSEKIVRRLTQERGTWVLATRGPGSSRVRLNQALQRVPDQRVTVLDFIWANAVDESKKNYRLSEYPGEYLMPLYRAFLLVSTPYEAIGPRLTSSIESSVRGGARLLVIGGPYAFGKGGYRDTPLEALLPVRSVGPFEVKHFQRPLKLEGTTAEANGWVNGMTVHSYHAVEVFAGAEVLVTADEKPMLVRRRLGTGEVYAFLGFSGGQEPTGYWNQEAWPIMVHQLTHGMN